MSMTYRAALLGTLVLAVAGCDPGFDAIRSQELRGDRSVLDWKGRVVAAACNGQNEGTE